jgi:hypothetical protein
MWKGRRRRNNLFVPPTIYSLLSYFHLTSSRWWNIQHSCSVSCDILGFIHSVGLCILSKNDDIAVLQPIGLRLRITGNTQSARKESNYTGSSLYLYQEQCLWFEGSVDQVSVRKLYDVSAHSSKLMRQCNRHCEPQLSEISEKPNFILAKMLVSGALV